ncbi:hypothetical protein [Dyella sp. A6]|uniref:hypothetical protein n=1 Tax=Dyella aluminiiresistens TaxID=3069105 RepID=UPI002E76A682|nr:hypothetical protein [Dyella sp. A6]
MPDQTRPPSGRVAALLYALVISGYGVWVLLGALLTMRVYSEGRGPVLVPLLLGALFVSLGPLLATLRVPLLRGWSGWRLDSGLRPSRETLLALACYLPALGVAGLARGDNDFWATRLLSAGLVACSLACLAYQSRRGDAASPPRQMVPLPVERVIAACYGGGLWLMLCVILQNPDVHSTDTRAWTIGLLMLALLSGLVEGVRWQSVTGRDVLSRWRQRFLAAGMTYAVPCLVLLLLPGSSDGRWLMLAAAVSCVWGRGIDLHLHETAIRHMHDAPPVPGEAG